MLNYYNENYSMPCILLLTFLKNLKIHALTKYKLGY